MPRSCDHVREQGAAVARRYAEGESTRKIAASFGVSQPIIAGILEARGVARRGPSESKRQYTLNESAFDVLTDEGAYWCGFLMADGSVGTGARGNIVELTLSACDAGHLEAFKRFLGSSQPLYPKPARAVVTRGKSYVCKPCARLQVASTRLCDALAKFGVVPGKTFRTDAGPLAGNPHFWRGVVDGDGTLTTRPHCGIPAYPILRVLGSQLLMEQFRAFALSLAPGFTAKVNEAAGIFEMRLAGGYAVRFVRAVYQEGHVALPRKLCIAQAMLRL